MLSGSPGAGLRIMHACFDRFHRAKQKLEVQADRTQALESIDSFTQRIQDELRLAEREAKVLLVRIERLAELNMALSRFQGGVEARDYW